MSPEFNTVRSNFESILLNTVLGNSKSISFNIVSLPLKLYDLRQRFVAKRGRGALGVAVAALDAPEVGAGCYCRVCLVKLVSNFETSSSEARASSKGGCRLNDKRFSRHG